MTPRHASSGGYGVIALVQPKNAKIAVMAGHSKWKNIRIRKGKQDAVRGKMFTKISREIIVAAKAGGGDPGMNPRLRVAVEKARAASMPVDNIKRAIDRGTGAIEGAAYEEIVYEGYGPGGSAIILECYSENRNRTVAEVRHAFGKHGGNLAENGSVSAAGAGRNRGWADRFARWHDHLFRSGVYRNLPDFGSRRIAELLAPYRMNLIAVRRKPRGDEPVRTVAESQIEEFLPIADHVIDVLPDSNATNGFFNVDRLRLFRPSAHFYNIGRGSTVDQDALAAMLQSGNLAAAYLDVMTPEPLPPDHPLWTTPRCYITPHTAGGHGGEFKSLVAHFLDNFHRFIHREPMRDQII